MKIRRDVDTNSAKRLQKTEPTKLPTLQAPSSEPTTKKAATAPELKSTASEAPKGQNGAPDWATPEFLQGVANKLNQQQPTSLPSGGKGLNVRLGAMTKPSSSSSSSTTPPAHLKKKSQTLLEQVKRTFAVIGGRPLTQEEINGIGKAVHLTRAPAVEPILVEGLKPTTSVMANWSTFMKRAVYMFPAPPKPGSLEDKVVRHQGMTEVIEINLKALDPSRLYKRVIDGAILYVTPEPITATALQHLGHIDDVMPNSRPKKAG